MVILLYLTSYINIIFEDYPFYTTYYIPLEQNIILLYIAYFVYVLIDMAYSVLKPNFSC